MMKKELWLIIFFYAVLLAGCSLLFNHFYYNIKQKEYNMSVGLNETQETNGVRLTLYQVIYRHNGKEQYIALYFKIDNQKDSAVVLRGSSNIEALDNMLLLRNEKEEFSLGGYGWDGEIAKVDDNGVIFSFPAKSELSFDLSFLADDKKLDGLECHIPLFINNEKIEFNFQIPSPEQIED